MKAGKDLVQKSEELKNLIELNIQMQLATYESPNPICFKRMQNGRWTLNKYIGATPPADCHDEWNKYLESRNKYSGKVIND